MSAVIIGLSPLPGVPGTQDLSADLRGSGIRDRLELLQASGKAIRQVQVAELIGRDPVRAVETSGLPARRAPAVEEVAVQIELEYAARRRIADPDEPVLIDEVIHHERVL